MGGKAEITCGCLVHEFEVNAYRLIHLFTPRGIKFWIYHYFRGSSVRRRAREEHGLDSTPRRIRAPYARSVLAAFYSRRYFARRRSQRLNAQDSIMKKDNKTTECAEVMSAT